MPSPCPPAEQLLALAEGGLEDALAEELAAHLGGCLPCQQSLATHEQGSWLADGLCALASPYRGEPELRDALTAIERLVGADAPLEPPPAQIRDYRLLELLGRGGMGVVYRAEHASLQRAAAVKLLPADRLRSPSAVARFEREMQAVGKLDHPNIVRAYDAGTVDGRPFLAMEYVAGLDLSRVTARLGPLTVADVCEAARQAACGLAHAHQHGLVHRDVKPSNLLLGVDGQIKVLDLGLAHAGEMDANRPSELTASGQVLGSLDYLAPEQAEQAGQADARSDLYGLGCTLFKLLTGRAPFAGPEFDSAVRKLRAHAELAPPDLRALRADVPPKLAELISQLLAKDPDRRPASASAVAESLATWSRGSDLALAARRAMDERDETVAWPAAGDHTPASARAATKEATGRVDRSRGATAWIAAVIVVALLPLAAIAWQLVIRIQDGGRTTEIKVPPGAKVEIVADTGAPRVEPKSAEPKPAELTPGLLVRLYPRTREQDDAAPRFIPPEQFGLAFGPSFVVETLAPWKYDEGFNAVAEGYLEVQQPGEYAFLSANFEDRNLLAIDGRVVCPFRDGDKTIARVHLRAGYVSIRSVGYFAGRGTVDVQWQPPGAKALAAIPRERLFHRPPAPSSAPTPTKPEPAAPQPSSASPPDTRELTAQAPGKAKPGLVVSVYARHADQKPMTGGYIPPERLGAPVETLLVYSLSPWKHPRDNNAVARGWLRVDVTGEYAFQSANFSDYNALYIDGRQISAYVDGDLTITRVTLERGWHPIESVGYVEGRGAVDVRWIPPGERILTPIPADRLYHVEKVAERSPSD